MSDFFNLYLPQAAKLSLERSAKELGISPSRLIRQTLQQAGFIEDTVGPYRDRGGKFSRAAILERRIKRQLAEAPCS